MGLFGAPPALVGAVGSKLVNKEPRARRELARAQLAILGEVGARELLLAIGVDHDGTAGVVVVTNERIFTVWRGKLDRRIARADIRETKLDHPKAGRFLVIVSGPRLRLTFPSLEEADHFVQMIDLAMVNSRVVTRDIPILLPELYEEVLRTSGRPVEPRTVSDVALVASEMIATQAQIFFTGTGDPGAADRFTAGFGGYRDGTTADAMIDWLWDWDARCHEPLRRAVGVIRVSLIERAGH